MAESQASTSQIMGWNGQEEGEDSCYLHKFKLYETRSKFYMIGRDKQKCCSVLKIDRIEPSELNIFEDPTVYSESECDNLLKTIHEGNRKTGGLKFVTNCYGIVGFVKFLGPYYMLLITKRKKIGSICGQSVYSIAKTEIISLPSPGTRSNSASSENRYKKLLFTVNLTKDFFFSYSYHVMRSLQKNISDSQTWQDVYETMFVWNSFLTRGIRNHLDNTRWTVALVHGFFKQAKFSISGRNFILTLIARRSRHYAGTRYLKRGINEKGRVANDVETEQIVFEDTPGVCLSQLTSVVQNRGSIPLFWSQESSPLNLKPDIVLQKKDQNFEATRLHFANLARRYGNPIIILNLIKKRERKPRESILHKEFFNAIDSINKDFDEEDRLRLLHCDLHKISRRNAKDALALLCKVAAYAVSLTGFFYCRLTPALRLEDSLELPSLGKEDATTRMCKDHYNSGIYSTQEDNSEYESNLLAQPIMFQSGVLRTNCIDCLDRTNVAQYAYGLASLEQQLHVLGLIDYPKIDQDSHLADDLVSFYEAMGDTLALQYGGSAAHNTIFSERRGQLRFTAHSRELIRTFQRYCRNAYLDSEKQDAINVFLGHFQPQQGKPALWELDSDQHWEIGRPSSFLQKKSRSSLKKSRSDGNILFESKMPITCTNDGKMKLNGPRLFDKMLREIDVDNLPNLTPKVSSRECDTPSSRYSPSLVHGQLFLESDHIYFNEHGADCSNFLDGDKFSSDGNSCDEEICERSSLINSPIDSLSTENISNVTTGKITPALSENGSSMKGRNSMENQLHKNTSEFSAALFIGSLVEKLCH